MIGKFGCYRDFSRSATPGTSQAGGVQNGTNENRAHPDRDLRTVNIS